MTEAVLLLTATVPRAVGPTESTKVTVPTGDVAKFFLNVYSLIAGRFGVNKKLDHVLSKVL
jgi:hypothetical protein